MFNYRAGQHKALYMLKLAYRAPDDQQEYTLPRGVLGTWTSAMLTGAANVPASRLSAANARADARYRDAVPIEARKALTDKLIKDHHAAHGDVHVSLKDELTGAVGQSYDPAFNRVRSGPGTPHYLAHELGHAELRRSNPGNSNMWAPKRPVGKAIDFLRRGGSTRAKMRKALDVGTFGAGLASEEDYAGTVAGIHALPELPTLADEAYASLKGLNKMRLSGASPVDLKNYKATLGRAFGTYLAPAVANVASSVGMYEGGRVIRGIYDAIKKENEQNAQKTSVPAPA